MIFEVKNLACRRGERYLFRKLSFSLQEGQLFVVQGQNGAGKSSLLKILAGLGAPLKGSIQWQGKPLRRFDTDYHAVMSYLGHKNSLRKTLSPLENIYAHSILSGSKASLLSNAEELLCAFDLGQHAHLPCEKLSAGQKRKVALSTIILQQKLIWILDEPFTALDEVSIQALVNFFKAHLAKKGIIVIASHFCPAIENIQILNLSAREKLC